MRKYELLFVLPGTFDDKEVEVKATEVADVIKNHGTDVETHFLGKNRLAYPIKQIRYGYFYTAVFNAEPTSIKVLEDKLRLMRDVLRGIVTHFNTNLTTTQKIVYATDDAGVTTMHERPEARPLVMEKVEALVAPAPVIEEEQAPAVTTSAAERKIAELDMDSISKKLDDIMKGDVMPGV